MDRILPRLQYFEFRHQRWSRSVSGPLSNFYKWSLNSPSSTAPIWRETTVPRLPSITFFILCLPKSTSASMAKSSPQVRTHTLEKLLSYRPQTLETQMKACTLWEKHTTAHITETGVAAIEIEEVVLNVRAGGQRGCSHGHHWGSLKIQSIRVIWDWQKRPSRRRQRKQCVDRSF